MNQMAETALVHRMGQNGFKYLSTAGTATYATTKMCKIVTITASTVTCVSVRGDSLTAVACPANFEIVGEFSSVTIAGAGGAALAYLSTR